MKKFLAGVTLGVLVTLFAAIATTGDTDTKMRWRE